MKKLPRRLIAQISLRSLVTIFSLAALAFLVLFKLDTLLPGWNAAEIATRSHSLSLHSLLYQPVNAPYKILVYALIKTHLLTHSILAVRLVSAFFGAGAVLIFFFIVRCWASTFVAWLSTFMLATSTWFLRSARFGIPDVLLFGLILLYAFNLWVRRSHHRRLVIALFGLMMALGLYVPGIIWFMVIAVIWQHRLIINVIRRLPVIETIGLTIGALAILTPLGWGIAHNYQLAWSVLGLPNHLPAIWPTLRRLIDVPINLFVRGPFLPGLWVGRTPILDVLETTLFVFGVYACWQNRLLRRLIAFIVVFVVTAILSAVNGPVSLSLVMPFIYFMIAAGLAYLINEWLSTFPRNPLARGLGMTIVVLAIAASCFYQLNRYFIAWPHMTTTNAIFSEQLKS